jgi:hypothetical protein
MSQKAVDSETWSTGEVLEAGILRGAPNVLTTLS